MIYNRYTTFMAIENEMDNLVIEKCEEIILQCYRKQFSLDIFGKIDMWHVKYNEIYIKDIN